MILSQALLPDEAAQVLDASVYALGYDKHPPFYSWIVKSISLFAGINIYSLTLIKYSILFIFYSSFYLLCKKLWSNTNALLITATLLIFPTYTYSFNYDLTHTILVTMMCCVTLYVYINLLKSHKLFDYICLGLCFGLGLLSKYNYIFMLVGLILASLTTKLGRKTILNKNSLITAVTTTLLMIPHTIWVFKRKFFSVTYALDEANKESGFWKLTNIFDIAGSYWELLLYIAAIIIIFCPSVNFVKSIFSKSKENLAKDIGQEVIVTIRYTALYCLLVPLVIIFIFQLENFCGRWISPIYFTVAIALFTFIFKPGLEDKDFNIPKLKTRKQLMVLIPMSIVLVISIVKLTIAFAPQLIGGKSKVLIPFKKISQQLTNKLNQSDINISSSKTVLLVPNKHIGGNLKAQIPGSQIKLSYRFKNDKENPNIQKLVLISKEKEQKKILNKNAYKEFKILPPLEAKYINSTKKYKLGLAVKN